MKKALISPNEPVLDGYRVAQVLQESFDVAEPLFWVDCEDTIKADEFYYNVSLNIFVEVPELEGNPTPASGVLTTEVL